MAFDSFASDGPPRYIEEENDDLELDEWDEEEDDWDDEEWDEEE